MPTNSNRTSNHGPRVSHVTTKSYSGPGHYLVPSWMTLESDGLFQSDGTLDVTAVSGVKFSGITTAAPATSFIPAGFLSITSYSATSLVLAVNSGGTIYTFTNATAE